MLKCLIRCEYWHLFLCYMHLLSLLISFMIAVSRLHWCLFKACSNGQRKEEYSTQHWNGNWSSSCYSSSFQCPLFLHLKLRVIVCSVLFICIRLQIHEALKIDDKYPNALTMLGDLELKSDDWVKAKDTFRAARDATNGKDSYSTLSLVCSPC